MTKLRAPKPVEIRAIRSNAGLAAWYRKKLLALIEATHRSLRKWLIAAYRDAVPESVAQDLSPAKKLDKAMRGLGKRWNKSFDKASKEIAKAFATKSHKYADLAFKSALKDSGFAVEFAYAPVADTVDMIVAENVGLIKSIPEQYLREVRGVVLKSVQQGRKLDDLTKLLEERYNVTRSRAELIARDQNNKATAAVIKTRQKNLGITQAKWQHTMASKNPREEHASWQGKVYDIDKGMYSKVDGEYVWPGTAINCRCTAKSIIPSFDEENEE